MLLPEMGMNIFINIIIKNKTLYVTDDIFYKD